MPDAGTANLVGQIELYLLDRADWVPTREICERFGVRDRQLRRDGKRKGLIDHCAVSSTNNGENGFIHHRFLPTEDYLPIKHGRLKHAISEIRKVRDWDSGRLRVKTGKPPAQYETLTGQSLLPLTATVRSST
jgi:hypothetical protein